MGGLQQMDGDGRRGKTGTIQEIGEHLHIALIRYRDFLRARQRNKRSLRKSELQGAA